ncbi:hypothetical protein GQ53DRAFT_754571 [Thozetella sp. PMI_491]|nr:hypothetical protein GQ53DRAFT_754571 [Thozetella sp. PMI_491]
MSSEAQPISPERFAAALKDLSLSSLHIKVLELRNSIAHLDYSNEQLRPFAEGAETAADSENRGQPDPDCVDAIRENEEVISRMQERIRLVRVEVEERGFSWTEFQSKEEAEAAAAAEAPVRANGLANGEHEAGQTTQHTSQRQGSSPWTDGTFQTGVIRNGEIHMDSAPGQSAGGSISDEELRRRVEQQLGDLGSDDADEEGGMHL